MTKGQPGGISPLIVTEAFAAADDPFLDPFAPSPAAVATALVHYPDADLTGGLAVLDSWGLIHACFGQSDALTFTTSHANLKYPASLNDMVAPYFPETWRKSQSAPILLDLLWSAQ